MPGLLSDGKEISTDALPVSLPAGSLSYRPFATEQAGRRPRAVISGVVRLAASAAIVGALGCSAEPAQDLRERSQLLSSWLYSGVHDSLPPGIIIDLQGDGDSVLVRWFVDQKVDSPGPDWPSEVIVTLEGRDAGSTFLSHMDSVFGRELRRVEDGLYPGLRLAQSIDYRRIARFSRLADNTVTMEWEWVGDSLIGGWMAPSGRAVPSEFEQYQTKTALRLPFDDEWLVSHGGRKPHENYHVQDLTVRFAYDFVVDSAGSLFRTDGKTNADFYCYGRPILAPAAGRVVAAVDTFQENEPWHRPPGYRGPGNHVFIDHGNGEISGLAHFRQGSVTVAVGQVVRAGDKIGECGNNGLSDAPHLHYQLQLDPRPGERVVPAFFRDYWADSTFVRHGEPRGGQRVRGGSRP